jgi:hypothetical protein
MKHTSSSPVMNIHCHKTSAHLHYNTGRPIMNSPLLQTFREPSIKYWWTDNESSVRLLLRSIPLTLAQRYNWITSWLRPVKISLCHSRLVSWRCSFESLSERWLPWQVLPQSIQENAAIVSRLGSDSFLSNPFQFINHSNAQRYSLLTDSAVKQPIAKDTM